MRRGMGVLACILLLPVAVAYAAGPSGPYEPDPNTLLLCHFDGSGRADLAKGASLPRGEGELAPDGKFKGGVRLCGPSGVRYPAGDGNLNCAQGMIEFWIKPNWDGNDGVIRSLVSASGRKGNYLGISKLGEKQGTLRDQLSFSMSSQPPGAEKAVCVSARCDISQWKKGEWHHVAAAWGGGELRLYLDGEERATAKGAQAPCGPMSWIYLGPSNCDAVMDELRVSDVPRRFGPFPEEKGAETPMQHFDEKGDLVVPIADGAPITVPNPYRFLCNLPPSPSGYTVAAKDWVSEMDPAATPEEGPAALSSFAAPGQYEPFAFVIYAQKEMKDIRVEVSDLRCGSETISARDVESRWAMRGPRRRRYRFPPKDFLVVTTFLPALQPMTIPAGNFREIVLIAHVPGKAKPGVYEGKITVSSAPLPPVELPIKLHVLPFALKDPPNKKYGMYYNLSDRLLTPDVADLELQDMKAHGVEALFPFLGIRYRLLPSGELCADYGAVEKGLLMLRKNGFAGLVIIETGLQSAARLLGHDVQKGATGESLDTDPKFQQAAKQAIHGLKEVQKRFPEFEIVLTHMDEVFNEGRLPMYIRLTRAAQQEPGFRYYITFHTIKPEADAMRKEIDPYVDIRCHHSNYTFDWWLTRGHTLEEYAEELKKSGDEGAFYFNPVGAFCDAERYRVFNGIYLWLGPFKYHIPYIYSWIGGDPLNDLDGSGSDHIFAFYSWKERRIIPAKIWEGYRQGIYDTRYLYTLESAIESAKDTKPNETKAARQWIENLKAKIPKP